MDLRRIMGLTVLVFGMSGMAVAAVSANLADAAENEEGALIRTLLGAGNDVNATQVDGMTALHWAAYHDDAETAALLVRSGAHVNAKNRYGVSALSLAATNGNAALVKLLVDAGANPNATLSGGETVLMTAAHTGSLEAVNMLLAKGADPNAREQRQQTALMWAAAEGHASIVQVLIDAGADFRPTLKSGFNSLFFAVREGSIDVVHMLLKAGADVNEVLERVKDGPDGPILNQSDRPVDDGMTPLLLAVRNGHFELAVALVKAGADPNDQRTGFTALHTMSWVRKPDASDRGDPAPIGSGNLTSLGFVREMVALGADVNARLGKDVKRPPHTASRLGREGATPFFMAADRADAPLMRQLLDLGADPSLPNAANTTPLMAAAGLGTNAPSEEAGTDREAQRAVKLLLDLGADLDAVDDQGNTAMHGAAFGEYPGVVELLGESGANCDIWSQENELGLTPLFIAEGFRVINFKRSRPTLDAVTALMIAEGISLEGPRPAVRDAYAKRPEKPVKK